MRRTLAAVCGGLLLATLVYGAGIEPRLVTVSHATVGDGRPEGSPVTKIALLGDLHFGARGLPREEKILRRLAQIDPDLILLVGDYVAWGGRGAAYERALDFLARLSAPLGVYAVLGDADATDSRKSCELCHAPGDSAPTARHQVVFLSNDSRTIELPGGRLRIVGVEPGRRRPSDDRLRRLLAGEIPTILLSHSSAVYREIDSSAAVLTVSGDTHGGQLWLPRWFWRLTRLKPDPGHVHGFFQDGRKALFVTRGLGTSRLPFRLGVPPEIAVLEFRGAGQ